MRHFERFRRYLLGNSETYIKCGFGNKRGSRSFCEVYIYVHVRPLAIFSLNSLQRSNDVIKSNVDAFSFVNTSILKYVHTQLERIIIII